MKHLIKTAALLSTTLCSIGLHAEPWPDAHVDAPPGSLDTDTCIEVEVNGEKILSYSCLTLKLKPTVNTQAKSRTQPTMGSESIVQKPGNQLDLFNYAATSHRMGNAFGNSVTPQRPAR